MSSVGSAKRVIRHGSGIKGAGKLVLYLYIFFFLFSSFFLVLIFFFQYSRLYMILSGLGQQEWRIPDVMHRLFKYLVPYLGNSLQNIRDRISK